MRGFLRYLCVLACVFSCSIVLWAIDFDTFFTGRTMRVDYFHSGTAAEEHISLDELRIEGDSPGSRTHLLDDSNLGKCLDHSSVVIAAGRLKKTGGFRRYGKVGDAT